MATKKARDSEPEVSEKSTAASKLEEVTTGMEPLLGGMPVVDIAGIKYTFRRIGLLDLSKFGKVIGMAARLSGQDFGGMEDMNMTTFASHMAVAVTFASNELLELMADLIQVSVEDIKDPEKFPVDSVFDLVDGLVQHSDLVTFFTRFKNMEGSNLMKNLQNLMG